MKSAFGNFDNDGNEIFDEAAILAKINYHSSKIVAIEDELKRLQFAYNNAPVESVAGTRVTEKYPSVAPTNNVLNVLDYVTKDEWDHFEGLAMVMLANGATLFELQQRLMGLG